jgi:single-strand DNA-binding protein
VNKVVLIGRLTKDPELKFTPGTGTAVTTFTLAVDRRTSKDGQREADFVSIVAWNKTAELVANYMSKGSLMGVSGRIQVRNYEAKDGTKRYVTEVVADEVQFLESKGQHNASNSNSGYNSASTSIDNKDYGVDMTPIDDGDIPF